MVQTLHNLTHCKPSCESHHMKHVVSYGKLHTSMKTVQEVTNSFYIIKISDLLLIYIGDRDRNLAF